MVFTRPATADAARHDAKVQASVIQSPVARHTPTKPITHTAGTQPAGAAGASTSKTRVFLSLDPGIEGRARLAHTALHHTQRASHTAVHQSRVYVCPPRGGAALRPSRTSPSGTPAPVPTYTPCQTANARLERRRVAPRQHPMTDCITLCYQNRPEPVSSIEKMPGRTSGRLGDGLRRRRGGGGRGRGGGLRRGRGFSGCGRRGGGRGLGGGGLGCRRGGLRRGGAPATHVSRSVLSRSCKSSGRLVEGQHAVCNAPSGAE